MLVLPDQEIEGVLVAALYALNQLLINIVLVAHWNRRTPIR